MTNSIVLALRFLFAPEVCSRFHETGLPKGEAERRKARTERPRPRTGGAPPVYCAIAARAAFGGRARLPALYRGSCQGLSTLAQSGPALHGSGDVRYPGSQLLADLRRGRPGEFPNRPRTELRAPSRAPLSPASIGRHRLTSLGRARWVLLVRRGVMIQEIPRDAAISLNLMQNFFGCLFDSHRRKCGTLP
jgi:hypothetical protein